jgi:hypothetical protein
MILLLLSAEDFFEWSATVGARAAGGSARGLHGRPEY